MRLLKTFIAVTALLMSGLIGAPASATVVPPTRPPLTGSASSGGHTATWSITGATTCPAYMVATAPDCSGVVSPGTLVTLEVTLAGTAGTAATFDQHADLTNTNYSSSPYADVRNTNWGYVPAGTSKSVTWTLNLRATTPGRGAETMMVRFFSTTGDDGVLVQVNLYNPWDDPNSGGNSGGGDTADLPGTPINLRLARVTAKKVRISWQAPVDGGAVSGYVLSVRAKTTGSKYGAWKTWNLSATQTAAQVSFPRKHVKVQAFVWAENEAGSGAATKTRSKRL